SLTLSAGFNSDIITVLGTAASTATTIDAGPGDDTIRVGGATASLDAIRGRLTVEGSAGRDSLGFDDGTADDKQRYAVASTGTDFVVGRDNADLAAYAGVETLTLLGTPFNDLLNISGTPAGIAITADGGGGDRDRLTGSNGVNGFFIRGLDSGVHSGTG